jgi:TetR/AcrR family transcriptional regulator
LSLGVSDNPARRRGRPRREDSPATSEAILAAALHAFAVHGYDGVSLRTLNSELGVSHNLLYQRFGSKAAIWRAAVDHAFGTLRTELKASVDSTITDPLLQFRLTIRRFLVFSAAHPDVFRLMSTEGNRDTERLDYLFDTYIGPATAPLGRALDTLIAEGRVRPISLRALHFLITAGGSAVFAQLALARRFDPADPLAPEQVHAHVDTVADLIVAGLETRRD